MAPQKRNRRHHDEDEVIEMENASSSLRQDPQRKKLRLSSNGPSKSRPARNRMPSSDSSSDDDSDEDIPDVDEDGHHGGPPATQYEIYRDGNFEHLEDTRRDDERATQAFKANLQRVQQIGENHAANNAIIQEITCYNFMCHKRLHVELGPLINFVVGHNGSGKSAVLTAITLCLGGKAAATNRGASLKSLIKEGEDTGLLVIRLKNEGNDAYQRDVYGDSIVIERKFSRTGTSGFKVKTATGRLISSKKGDVDDIVEYYQLQVDNPMNVLTQDAAKSFITASTPAQKYKFFKDGVQLSALDSDYNLVCNTCDQIETKVTESKDDILALKKIMEAAKVKYDRVKQNEGMAAKKKEMGHQLAWAQVQDVENELDKKVEYVAQVQREIDDAERTLNDKDASFQGLEQSLERAQETRRQLQEEMLPVKAEEETAKDAYGDAANAVKSNRNERAKLSENVAKAKQKVEKCKADIETENRRLEDTNGGANTRKLAEIEAAKQQVVEAKSSFDTHIEQRPELVVKRDEAQQEVKRLDNVVGKKRKEFQDAEQQLASLNSNRGDTMAGFDAKMPRLLQAIREEKRFREKPIGPMGVHIKLRNSRWSSVLESVLNSVLTSFLVTSKADQVVLSEILTRANMAHFCIVAIVNRTSIDTTGNEPDRQFETVLRVLDIDNELVRNYLIINNAIEQAILIEARQKAMEVMYDKTTPRPANVKFCLCLHDHQPGHGIRLGYSGSGGKNGDMGPVRPMNRRPRMTTDIESQISFQRQTVDHLRKEKQDMEQALQRAKGNVQRYQNALQQHEREKNKLKRMLQVAEENVENLTTELEDSRVKDGHLDALKGFLVEAEKELEIAGESYGNVSVEVENLNAQASEKKQELKAVRDRLAEQETKIQKVEEKMRRIETARHHALTQKNVADARIKVLRETKTKAEAKRDDVQEKLVRWNDQATQICAVRVQIPAGETGASLDAKYQKLLEKLKAVEKTMGATAEQINDEYAKATKAFKDRMKHQIGMEELLTLLKQAFMKRMEMFRAFQRHISARSRINFSYFLGERTFRGKLSIDHKGKKLDVHVEPDETAKSGKGRTTKTLSGGEKSFSSICLLLSLWEAMGAPLRCLDEFDVFMDDVNRDISTKMIISAARKSVSRQFILITPKALGAGVADHAKDVKIIKLFDPREKQRRINDMMEE